MKYVALILHALILLSFSSCASDDLSEKKEVPTPKDVVELSSSDNTVSHPYGGWYCPDNVYGFPAVDVAHWEEVPVINGRMPTEEETRTGASLIYIPSEEYPEAKPMDVLMPKLARYYNQFTQKDELIIVIQAVIVAQDSLVGFRYVNGGNGSARYHEVDFLSKDESKALPNTPFVTNKISIDASPSVVFDIITNPEYAKELGAEFDKGAYVESDWERGAEVYFKYGPDKIANTGVITAFWEDLYIQVDYDIEGYHYVEKYLVSKDEETGLTGLTLVAGPYSTDYEDQVKVWNNWLIKVSELSYAKDRVRRLTRLNVSGKSC